MPMTPLSGVRTSWLILAKNELLERLAASATSRACLSAVLCRSRRALVSRWAESYFQTIPITKATSVTLPTRYKASRTAGPKGGSSSNPVRRIA